MSYKYTSVIIVQKMSKSKSILYSFMWNPVNMLCKNVHTSVLFSLFINSIWRSIWLYWAILEKPWRLFCVLLMTFSIIYCTVIIIWKLMNNILNYSNLIHNSLGSGRFILAGVKKKTGGGGFFLIRTPGRLNFFRSRRGVGFFLHAQRELQFLILVTNQIVPPPSTSIKWPLPYWLTVLKPVMLYACALYNPLVIASSLMLLPWNKIISNILLSIILFKL